MSCPRDGRDLRRERPAQGARGGRCDRETAFGDDSGSSPPRWTAPGVHSARFAGEATTPTTWRCCRAPRRVARWPTCVIALVDPRSGEDAVRGRCTGRWRPPARTAASATTRSSSPTTATTGADGRAHPGRGRHQPSRACRRACATTCARPRRRPMTGRPRRARQRSRSPRTRRSSCSRRSPAPSRARSLRPRPASATDLSPRSWPLLAARGRRRPTSRTRTARKIEDAAAIEGVLIVGSWSSRSRRSVT